MEDWKTIDIVTEKHEIDFGDFIPGSPVSEIEDERLVHIPGNDALYRATIHFCCDPDRLVLDGKYQMIDRLINEGSGKMSVTLEELKKEEEKDEE
ncbi:MAG: hypothetical protein K6F99_10405 [Lachnospiraceae bacterium]|nr:hypothetical protein [Lachnospiraceae bacterium]